MLSTLRKVGGGDFSVVRKKRPALVAVISRLLEVQDRTMSREVNCATMLCLKMSSSVLC